MSNESNRSHHSPDRANIFPLHTGPNVLPNSPFFSKLLRHAHRRRIFCRDHRLEVEKSYGDLLTDALRLRASLETSLSPGVREQLKRGDECFIGILAGGGYEFAVAVVAALAAGAAIVPMSIANPPEEALYFVEKSRQIAILSSSAAAGLARSVVALLEKKTGMSAPPHVDVSHIIFSSTSRCTRSQVVISSDRYLDDNAAGAVIFTSGTTGKPKGAVLRRAYIHETALNVINGYDVDHTDVVLHTLPVHHATGLGTTFFTFLVAGACIEFRTHGGFDSGWVWERLSKGGITMFSGVPTMYLRLMWHYQKSIADLPIRQRDKFVNGVKNLKCMLSGSSALPQPVQDFFTQLRDNGKPGIFVRYGSSEIPGCIRVSADADFARLPQGSVGSPTAGVDVRISLEDGELLIKSPLMFSGYLFDRDATIAAHDMNGWFKTGDIARQDGPYIFIVGRASIDIIKSGGYKIGALEIEKACSELPYVREVTVMGVEDEEFGQRVAAAIVLNTETPSSPRRLRLHDLRNDLRRFLPAYKIPSLLRVVDGELPKGDTGKIQKKVLGPKLFPMPGWRDIPEVQSSTKKSDFEGVKAKI